MTTTTRWQIAEERNRKLANLVLSHTANKASNSPDLPFACVRILISQDRSDTWAVSSLARLFDQQSCDCCYCYYWCSNHLDLWDRNYCIGVVVAVVCSTVVLRRIYTDLLRVVVQVRWYVSGRIQIWTRPLRWNISLVQVYVCGYFNGVVWIVVGSVVNQ